MQPMVGIQLSVFGKTLQERFLQMTGWICSHAQCVHRCRGFSASSWMAHAGMVRGGRADTAWRLLDAQYWGEPALVQRRKRVFVVADFAGQRAGEVLFKPRTVLPFPAAGGPGGCPPPREVEYLLLKQGGRYPSSDRFPSTDANYGTGRRSERVLCQLRTRRRTVPNSACECNGAVFVLVRG